LLLVEHASLPMLAKMSELQAAAAAAMITSATLSAAEQAELSTIAIGVPWASDADVAKVLNAFAVAAPLAPGKLRRSQQNYMSAHHYLTARMWDAMLDGTVPSDTKLTAFLGHCIHLGMRCPTEPTLKWLCSLWLVCCTDPGELARLSVLDKTLKFKQVKQHFNQYRLRAPDPPVWVERLPAKPVELLRDFPLVYRTAFPGEASPAPPAVSVELIGGFDMSYSCRGGLKTAVTFGSGASSSSAVAISSSGSGMDIERLLMGFMQGMQQSQQQMMQNMQQPQHQLMLQPKPAMTMAALEDRSYRQAGLMGFEPPLRRQRTSPLFEELTESPPATPAKAPALTFAEAASPRGTVVVYDAETAPDHAAAVGSAPNTMAVVAAAPEPPMGGDIGELFGLLQERKDDAKAKAAEAKKAKAVEAKAAKEAAKAVEAATAAATAAAAAAAAAAVVEVGKVAAAVAVAKGKSAKAAKATAAKAAASATAAAGEKGKVAVAVAAAKNGKAAKAAAKPVPEADAACKDLSAADKAALAKAKASQKSGKDRKLKVSDGWGCSKCRWRPDGCTQCKNKTFTGFVWNPTMKG
jgi:hypothetical protein